MTTPTLLLTPRRTALLADHDNALDVLVRVQAPDLPAEQVPKRSPLNIALVIDRSGSMSGQPLDEAKRCAEFVIDGLTAADRASLVVYDNNVNTLVPLTALTDREVFRRAIRAVTSGGMTNLHGGWLAGAGVQGGRAYGATDPVGLRATEDTVHIHRFHATLMRLMGLDHRELTYLHNGLEQRLTGPADVEVVDALIS